MSDAVTLSDFELQNVVGAPDPFQLFEYANRSDVDVVVLVFQRDYRCLYCRRQVQEIASRYDEFRERDAAVVSVLPESVERTRKWQDQYSLPFPLLADESKTTGERYDQPTRFGVLGAVHDLVGRMPETVVIDARDEEPHVAHVHRGKLPADRPSVDDILGHIDDVLAAETQT